MARNIDNQPDETFVEIAAGLVLAAIAAMLLIWIIPANVHSGSSEYDIAPSFFPTLSAWFLMGLSLALVALKASRLTSMRQFLANSGTGIEVVFRIVCWSLVGGLAYLGMTYVNFILTGIVLIIAGAFACHYRQMGKLLCVAIGLPIIIQNVAWLVFEVRLP